MARPNDTVSSKRGRNRLYNYTDKYVRQIITDLEYIDKQIKRDKKLKPVKRIEFAKIRLEYAPYFLHKLGQIDINTLQTMLVTSPSELVQIMKLADEHKAKALAELNQKLLPDGSITAEFTEISIEDEHGVGINDQVDDEDADE